MNENSNNPVISVGAYELPLSRFLGEETRTAIAQQQEEMAELAEQTAMALETIKPDDMPAIRQAQSEVFYQSAGYKKLLSRYPVNLHTEEIGGVYTETFTPVEGVSPANQKRVLINFHGGSFTAGARTESHKESIPIAATGKIKVISVDYRMSPEHKHPAASNDALAVYKGLLNNYKPENIGIYGYSAGAMLSAQLIARLLQENLPLPGAIAMCCWGAHSIDGDSIHTIFAQMGVPPIDLSSVAYFDGADAQNPLTIPGASNEVLAQFPPSLVMTSTRDFMLSSAVVTHSTLVSLNVEADLHVWEGLDHVFLNNPEFAESRQAYDVLVRFFDKRIEG
jgi:acetyl esterase/lipase